MLPGRLENGNFISMIRKWSEMWNGPLLDHLQSMRLIAGNGIRIQHYANGTVIEAEAASAGAAAAVQPDEEDGGPFAVEIYNAGSDEAPEWRVKLLNSESRSGKAGLVTIGSYREMIEDLDWDAEPGMVYLDVTYDPETEEYNVIFDLEDELPETGDEQRYILRIGEITYDEETETYTAHQIRDYGDIEVLGRWVK